MPSIIHSQFYIQISTITYSVEEQVFLDMCEQKGPLKNGISKNNTSFTQISQTDGKMTKLFGTVWFVLLGQYDRHLMFNESRLYRTA